MRISIIDSRTYESLETIPPGLYDIESAKEGTNEQNRAFHALLTEFFVSGLHSYNAKSFDEFKNFIKRDFGAGFESYVCVVDEGGEISWCEVKEKSAIPANTAVDKDGKKMIKGKLKSWADYTKKERTETIDNLISAMIQAGCNSRKFEEILSSLTGVKG